MIGPVLIHDNGLRSFLPPCFCWELVGINGDIIDTVSDIRFSFNYGAQDTLINNTAYFSRKRIKLFGVIEEYVVERPDSVEPVVGKRFLVMRMENT